MVRSEHWGNYDGTEKEEDMGFKVRPLRQIIVFKGGAHTDLDTDP